VDGDGQRELVTITYRTDGDTVHWRHVAVAIEGARSDVVETDEGTYQSPQDQEAIRSLGRATCGDTTLAGGG
jgi:hypothetical protein